MLIKKTETVAMLRGGSQHRDSLCQHKDTKRRSSPPQQRRPAFTAITVSYTV